MNSILTKIHCSKKCVADNEDCSAQNHTLKVGLFERMEYLHKARLRKNFTWLTKF